MDALILRRHAAGPTGQPTTLDERISEVQRRYQADNPVPPETSRKQRSGRRERLQLVGRGAAPPFGLRCWWARAADDSSTTSDAQYSRRLAIWDPSKVSSAISRRCVDLQAGGAAARLQSPKAGCAQSSLG